MAKEKRKSCFGLALLTFILGYVTAHFVDLEEIAAFIQGIGLHKEREKTKNISAVVKKEERAPKLEFYTLLASEKVENPALAKKDTPIPPKPEALKPQEAAPPVLAKMQAPSTVTVSAPRATNAPTIVPVKAAVALPVAPVQSAAAQGAFSIQVASFKSRQEADAMKGRLIMRGFSARVVAVNHAIKGSWFRVLVGPYANKTAAQRAQVDLAHNERLSGILTAG